MAKKRTAIEKAIDTIQAEIDIRQSMIALLRQQQSTAPKRKARTKAAELEARSARTE